VKRKAKVIIIGLGSAGLSALAEVSKVTDDFFLVQNGPYGTSCARKACMPTKTLLEVANLFQTRKAMAKRGVSGTKELAINTAAVLRYVRELRDTFVTGMIEETEKYNDKIIQGKARFLEPTLLQVGEDLISGDRIVIATGSRPVYPNPWKRYRDFILTTEDIIETQEFPKRMAVVGLGPAGLEYAQALSRLGVSIIGIHASSILAGVTDPEINAVVRRALEKQFIMVLNQPLESISLKDNEVVLQIGSTEKRVDKVLLTMGRQPNIDDLGLERLGITIETIGSHLSRNTLQIGELPIFIAGDANDGVQILHEAIDEGHIAGYNAARDTSPQCFERRVSLSITFTEPNIVAVGKKYKDLLQEDIVIGQFNFSKQARARMTDRNSGLIRIYADKNEGRLLGAEMAAPAGEHMAHFLALAIHQQMTVQSMLMLPIYHPVIEEGLRTAIRDASRQVASKVEMEQKDLLLCRCQPAKSLC